MDEFLVGPKSFDIWFSSMDKSSYLNADGSYNFVLKKPLEFGGEWEIGIKQIIIKSPINSEMFNIFYTLPDKPDTKPWFNLRDIDLSNSATNLIATLNSKIPSSLQKDFSFLLEDDGFVMMNVKDAQVQFQNSFLSDILGFSSEKTYPEQYPTQTLQVRADKPLQLVYPIFSVFVDVTLPGSEILATDVFSDTNTYKNYKYDKISYYNILRNYISSINISITNVNNKKFKLDAPFFIKFHLRRSSIL